MLPFLICFSPWFSIAFICFSNALPRREYLDFSCSFILLWSDNNISWLVRYSYLSILLKDNAEIFAASLLILSCILPSLIVLYLSKRFFLKRKGLSDARVLPITQKDYGFKVHFL